MQRPGIANGIRRIVGFTGTTNTQADFQVEPCRLRHFAFPRVNTDNELDAGIPEKQNIRA